MSDFEHFLTSLTVARLREIHARVYTNKGSKYNKSELVERLMESCFEGDEELDWLQDKSGITLAEIVDYYKGKSENLPTGKNKEYYIKYMLEGRPNSDDDDVGNLVGGLENMVFPRHYALRVVFDIQI